MLFNGLVSAGRSTASVRLWRLDGCVLDYTHLSVTGEALIAVSTHMKGVSTYCTFGNVVYMSFSDGDSVLLSCMLTRSGDHGDSVPLSCVTRMTYIYNTARSYHCNVTLAEAWPTPRPSSLHEETEEDQHRYPFLLPTFHKVIQAVIITPFSVIRLSLLTTFLEFLGRFFQNCL